MKKVIFLDRDGVINKYPGHFKYVTSQKEFKFLRGSKNAISRLSKAGYKLFIVSNQAGVSKGLYSQEILDKMTGDMLKEIRKQGGKIEKVLYCVHQESENCGCRKPKTGLIKKALKLVKGKVDIENSFFIGDSIRDVKTGKSAGCKTILVLSGRESADNMKEWEAQPDFIAKNLSRAADIILNK
ncbi:MAG: HAD family hydrolase [Candidatus Omnitrophica bacterium]|nr:HAD family hydrolase [Candidatus Omnitrophota bacterium]MDD5356069.1 HAD family hydrolase [Candidatus Omnitrophota bacterium]